MDLSEATFEAFELSQPESELGEVESLASAWDVATRYHEYKRRALSPIERRTLRSVSVQAVLTRARAILGSVSHPLVSHTSLYSEVPFEAEGVDFDVEATIDEAPRPGDEPWMSYTLRRKQALMISVDTSLSMTGEKLALTAVALAVVLLQFPEDPLGIVAFENEAQVLKQPEERIGLETVLERFLDVPAQGYTHLEDGLLESLKVLRRMSRGRGRAASTVLLTDGKYTAGRDPAYLASRFRHLIVLKMGEDRSSLSLCEDLARLGRGRLQEVEHLEDLPQQMYAVVKDLLRGRS